jgi:hypothetical protein
MIDSFRLLAGQANSTTAPKRTTGTGACPHSAVRGKAFTLLRFRGAVANWWKGDKKL